MISKRFWDEIKNRAKKRNIQFSVSIDEAWKVYLRQNKRCALTGQPLEFISSGYRGTASLDRIDSDKPYVSHNIQWVLGDINIMKKEHNTIYFKYLCSLVANFS